MGFPEDTAWAVPEKEPALVLRLNLETLKHQREFLSLCSMKEGMPSFFLSAFLFKALAGGVGGRDENKNKAKATATPFYG